MPIPNEQGPRDHRPLIYRVAAVLILGAAAVLFWPREPSRNPSPEMVLTPESVREPVAEETSGESTRETTLQAGVETPPLPGDALSAGERQIVDARPQDQGSDPAETTERSARRGTAPAETSVTTTKDQTERQERARPTQADTLQPRSSGRFVLNVGAFSSRENAERLVERLARQTIDAHVHMTTTETGATVYRVRVGYFTDRGDAEQYGAYLARNHDLKSWVGPR
jgi:cell division septation protein DedD